MILFPKFTCYVFMFLTIFSLIEEVLGWFGVGHVTQADRLEVWVYLLMAKLCLDEYLKDDLQNKNGAV